MTVLAETCQKLAKFPSLRDYGPEFALDNLFYATHSGDPFDYHWVMSLYLFLPYVRIFTNSLRKGSIIDFKWSSLAYLVSMYVHKIYGAFVVYHALKEVWLSTILHFVHWTQTSAILWIILIHLKYTKKILQCILIASTTLENMEGATRNGQSIDTGSIAQKETK
jgi:hypothetical protein